MSFTSRRIGVWLAFWGLGLLGVGTPAAAQPAEPVEVAVFPPATNDSSLSALANRFGSALIAELRRFNEVSVAARPALDLPTTQLAIGCDDSSDDCLRGATSLAHTQALMAPSLQVTPEHDIVVSLLYFDAQAAGSRTITRTYPAPNAESHVLDGLSDMVRELLGKQPDGADTSAHPAAPGAPGVEPGPSEPPAREPPAAPPPAPASQASTGLPILPLVLTAAGAVLLGTGAAFGIAASESKREYRDLRPQTIPELKDAADTLSTGQQQASLCNWSLAIGGALVATGVTLWIVEDANAQAQRDSARREGSKTALVPAVGPGSAALFMQHRW